MPKHELGMIGLVSSFAQDMITFVGGQRWARVCLKNKPGMKKSKRASSLVFLL